MEDQPDQKRAKLWCNYCYATNHVIATCRTTIRIEKAQKAFKNGGAYMAETENESANVANSETYEENNKVNQFLVS